MRVVVQRVRQASCTVNGTVVGAIEEGFLLLVGFTHQDTLKDVQYIAKKVANFRIFDDEFGQLNKSILDYGYAILSISQFTLYGDASKGNRPSFIEAMRPEQAEALYHQFNHELIHTYGITTQIGRFGEHMDISLINDGPVTIVLER